MANRVSTALAGPDWTPLPAHPAPNATFWNGSTNCRRMSVATDGHAYLQLGSDTTLVLIYAKVEAYLLINTATSDISAVGFPLAPGYHSFSVPRGSALRMQAVDTAGDVYVLEG